MHQVVSFSGGRTSAYLVHLMEAQRKAGASVHFIFMDTGTVITKDGPKVKKLHQTERMWVVGKNEFYHKETGRRHFAENTRRRLLLDTIKPIEVKHV